MNHESAIAELIHLCDQLRDAQEAMRRDIAELRAVLGLPASDTPAHDPRADYEAFRAQYSASRGVNLTIPIGR